MTRTMGHYVSPSVVVLWIAELALAFVVVCLMAAPGGLAPIPHAWPGGISGDVFDHAAFLAVTLGATAGAIGLYRPENCFAPRRVALHAAVVALLAFPVALLIGTVFDTRGIGSDAIWVSKVLAVWIFCVLISRWLLRVPLSRALRPRRIAVVGDGETSARLRAALQARRGALFEIGAVLAPDARAPAPEELRRSGIWAVVAPKAADPAVTGWMVDCRLRGFRAFHEAGFCEQMLGRISLDLLQPSWFLDPTGFNAGAFSLRSKRLADIVISLVLLTLSLPVMALVMCAIRIDSRGPIFYRQERVGQGGSGFMLLKFRSMVADAEQAGRPVWAARRDPRVTRVGAFIRMTRIDELPQLWNVLRGDMSLVGPRPERPHFVRELARAIPFYAERSYVKPGITGWAQVNYPYGASVEDAREKLAYDLYYLRHRGFVFDLLILAATVRVILFREGAR